MQDIKNVSQQGGTTLHSRFALSTQVSEYDYLLWTLCEKQLSRKTIQLLLFRDFSPECNDAYFLVSTELITYLLLTVTPFVANLS